MDASELYWLAGLLEGEGTFVHGPPSAPTVPQIRVEMTDRDVVARVASAFERTVLQHTERAFGHKPSFSTTVKGASASYFMRLLAPVLGARRRVQIEAALVGPHNEKVRWLRRGAECTVSGCPNPSLTRSLCKSHYDSWWKARRRGQASPFTPRGPDLPETRLDIPTAAHAGAIPWLAGLLEGEGTFSIRGTYPVVSVNMCDRDVVSRAAALMALDGPRVWEQFDARDQARGWSRSYVTAVTGARAAVLMRTLRPLMGARRGIAIDRALAAYHPIRLTAPPEICVIEGCERPHRSRGLCNTHYMKWSRDRAHGREARVPSLR